MAVKFEYFQKAQMLMEYDKLSEWLNIEYKNLLELEKNATEENGGIQEKLRKLKKQSQELEIEYLNKEKQISTDRKSVV